MNMATPTLIPFSLSSGNSSAYSLAVMSRAGHSTPSTRNITTAELATGHAASSSSVCARAKYVCTSFSKTLSR